MHTEMAEELAFLLESVGPICCRWSKEEWRTIEYPGFRPSTGVNAWSWVSDRGRLLSNNLKVLEASQGGGYLTTTICVDVPGAAGIWETTSIHRIVAYTFLGNPPSPEYTVDHIDRIRHHNHVGNIRWASPNEQFCNRRYHERVFETDDGRQWGTMTALARDLGIPLYKVRAQCSLTQDGAVVIGEHRIRVHVLYSRDVLPPTHNVTHHGGRRKDVADTVYMRALRLFLDQGMTAREISEHWHIKEASVETYIHKAACASQATTLKRLASRLGLASSSPRQELVDDLDRVPKEEPFVFVDYRNACHEVIWGRLPDSKDVEVIRRIIRVLTTRLDST